MVRRSILGGLCKTSTPSRAMVLRSLIEGNILVFLSEPDRSEVAISAGKDEISVLCTISVIYTSVDVTFNSFLINQPGYFHISDMIPADFAIEGAWLW